jgi:hypothetical protein
VLPVFGYMTRYQFTLMAGFSVDLRARCWLPPVMGRAFPFRISFFEDAYRSMDPASSLSGVELMLPTQTMVVKYMKLNDLLSCT